MALGIAGIAQGSCSSTVFDDVSASLGDLCGYIEQGAEAGVVSQSNVEFRPNAPITRAELTKILFAARGILPAKGAFGFYDVPENMGTLRGYINA